MHTLDEKKTIAQNWFRTLRDQICTEFERLETLQDSRATFVRTPWARPEGGGGEMSVMKGRVFEKVGVNISTVHGEFSEQFRKEIPGAAEDARFWASGISLVAHMASPLVPAVHMNTRMIVVGEGKKIWFGGGGDLNPAHPFPEDTAHFHRCYKEACDATDPGYYEKFKAWCEDYFFIKHRNVARGVGGIFYDYLDTEWEKHFAFTQAVGRAFLAAFPPLVEKRMFDPFTPEERHAQLVYRGRYAEFNLLYDRGTRFGLMTGGNTEAILMSLPPLAVWE
jgi:coproporphyrinogen III oxidase